MNARDMQWYKSTAMQKTSESIAGMWSNITVILYMHTIRSQNGITLVVKSSPLTLRLLHNTHTHTYPPLPSRVEIGLNSSLNDQTQISVTQHENITCTSCFCYSSLMSVEHGQHWGLKAAVNVLINLPKTAAAQPLRLSFSQPNALLGSFYFTVLNLKH